MPLTYRGDKRIVTLAEPVRRLRHEATDAERVLWRRLRARQMAGAKFRRQHQYGPYILDFYCPERRLAVELDGGQHYEQTQVGRDLARTRYLAGQGVRVMRFSNVDLLTQTDSVIESIWLALQEGAAG